MKDEVKLHIYSADPSTILEIPFVDGGIKAGFPSPAQDYMTESIDLNKEIIRHKETTFLARVSGNFPVPTNDHQEIVAMAVRMLRDAWKNDDKYWYKKSGVIVWNICKDEAIQGNLFDTVNREKQAALAKAIEEINRKNGHNTIRVAVQGFEKKWHLKNEYIAKQYTTNIDDVIVVKAK